VSTIDNSSPSNTSFDATKGLVLFPLPKFKLSKNASIYSTNLSLTFSEASSTSNRIDRELDPMLELVATVFAA